MTLYPKLYSSITELAVLILSAYQTFPLILYQEVNVLQNIVVNFEQFLYLFQIFFKIVFTKHIPLHVGVIFSPNTFAKGVSRGSHERQKAQNLLNSGDFFVAPEKIKRILSILHERKKKYNTERRLKSS